MLWRQVHWSRPLDTDAVIGLLTRLASDTSRGTLVWETRSEAGQIRYLLGGAPADLTEATGLTTRLVPGASVTKLASERREAERCARVQIRQRSLSLAIEASQPMLAALLVALASAHLPEDVLVLQVVLGSAQPPELVSPITEDPTLLIWDKLVTGTRPASAELRSRVKHKLDQYRFRAVMRIGVSGVDKARRMVLVQRVLSALRQIQSSGTRVEVAQDRADAVDLARIPLRLPLRLTPAETMAFLGLPVGEGELPGLPSLHPRLLPPPESYLPVASRAFATTTAPGADVPIGISIADACFHTHVVGPTGTGKSNVLLHLIRADIEAGRSLVLIDPKRDLAMDALTMIPEKRQGDVVVIDPTLAQPVGINPLATTAERRPLVADSILAVFKGMFPSAFGPRTSDVLHASLLTLMQAPDATLVQLPRLLTEPGFRHTLTSKIHDDAGLGAFWAQWEALSPNGQMAAIAPVMSRLRQFLLRPGLRAVLDQPQPRFQLGELFARPRIVILTLNKGLLGAQSASLLGSLVVGQLWQLTLARARIPQAQRTPVSVFVDEAQNFLHLDSDLGEALEQSRSLRVAWHLAHQYRGQMPPKLLASIDNNARNKIVFSLGTADAIATARNSSLAPEDFSGLHQYEIYTSLMNRGHQTGWFSGRTLPPPQAISEPSELISESQVRYGQAPPPLAVPTTSPQSSSDSGDEETFGRAPRRPL